MEITESNLGKMLYEGKAKKLFEITGRNDLIYIDFQDNLTAFNALKKGSFEKKGALNRDIASLIFRYLKKGGVATHWQKDVSDKAMVALKVAIVPLEVVVRNVLAGSTAKKFGLPEGEALSEPLVEFFFKKDELGDPFVSDDQAIMLKVATREDLAKLKTLALKVNALLIPFFAQVGIRLVDFKLEFGRLPDGEIILADEITPDSCRLWDAQSGEKLDKDRFRRDLGRVKESYELVWDKLCKQWENKL